MPGSLSAQASLEPRGQLAQQAHLEAQLGQQAQRVKTGLLAATARPGRPAQLVVQLAMSAPLARQGQALLGRLERRVLQAQLAQASPGRLALPLSACQGW